MTQLPVVSPVTGLSDLRDAAIAWADTSAALAQALAAGLRSGQDAAGVAHSVMPLARASSALLESLCELLGQEALGT